jgi:hypothetical protein
VYRVCLLNKELGLQFNHFVIKDEEPLLYHTGYRASSEDLREAVARVLDPRSSAGLAGVISNRTSAAR